MVPLTNQITIPLGSRAKLAISLVIAAGGLMLIGWCGISGGLSINFMKQKVKLKLNKNTQF